jgi:hypothetical protein
MGLATVGGAVERTVGRGGSLVEGGSEQLGHLPDELNRLPRAARSAPLFPPPSGARRPPRHGTRCMLYRAIRAIIATMQGRAGQGRAGHGAGRTAVRVRKSVSPGTVPMASSTAASCAARGPPRGQRGHITVT